MKRLSCNEWSLPGPYIFLLFQAVTDLADLPQLLLVYNEQGVTFA